MIPPSFLQWQRLTPLCQADVDQNEADSDAADAALLQSS